MNVWSVTCSMKAYQLHQMDWPPYNSSGTTDAQLDSKNNQLNTIIRAVIKTNVLSTDFVPWILPGKAHYQVYVEVTQYMRTLQKDKT